MNKDGFVRKEAEDAKPPKLVEVVNEISDQIRAIASKDNSRQGWEEFCQT